VNKKILKCIQRISASWIAVAYGFRAFRARGSGGCAVKAKLSARKRSRQGLCFTHKTLNLQPEGNAANKIGATWTLPRQPRYPAMYPLHQIE
jgi:hypothetical protein